MTRRESKSDLQLPSQCDRSKQLPALLSVDSSVYRTLARRSSGENASLFRALPLYSFCDALSPLTDVMSPRQFNCVPFLSTIRTHSSWCPLSPPIPGDWLSQQSPGELLSWCSFSLDQVLPLSSTLWCWSWWILCSQLRLGNALLSTPPPHALQQEPHGDCLSAHAPNWYCLLEAPWAPPSAPLYLPHSISPGLAFLLLGWGRISHSPSDPQVPPI